jgi:2-polyprenyl-6-methoxyphenol hydroxylase-like FAD-dependent oxidoreductase
MAEVQDVVVAGGGIGGLALASALRARGIGVTVLEQAERLEEIGAAIGVQTNAVRALRSMGLADELIRSGVPIEFYEYVDWKGRRLVRWSQGDIGRRLGEPTVVVHRADLQRVLLGGAGVGTLRLGTACASFDEDEGGVTVRLADGAALRAKLLVGADGIRSALRGQLLGEQPLRYSGWAAYRGIATFSHPSLPVGLARQTLGRGRTFGTWHLPEGRLYWVATITERLGEGAPPGERRAHVLRTFRGTHEPLGELVEATQEEAVLRHEVSDRLPVDSWSSTRVTLLGDAAHPTTPVTGQGGGQAIIDAAVLADEIAALPSLDDASGLRGALQRYEERRRPVTSSITREAWRISGMHHVHSRVAASGRDLSLRLTPTRVWHRRMEHRLAF